MSLINCPECSQKISDKAPTCPQCGTPIAGAMEAKAAGASLVTTQGTSKKLKLHTLGSVILMIVGFMIIMTSSSQPDNESGVLFSTAMATVGLVWFLVTRIRIWWHHS